VPPAIYPIVNREDNLQAMYSIAFFARAKKLREHYKMDPEIMIDVRNIFKDEDGEPIEVPFDWRSAYPHAIYWAHVGLRKLDELEERTLAKWGGLEEYRKRHDSHGSPEPTEGEGIFEFRRIMLHRVIYGSMQGLVHHGRLMFDTRGRLMMEFGPDYRFADAALPLYTDVMEVHGARFKMGTEMALMNFLKRGVVEFYLTQRLTKAQNYFERLEADFPHAIEGTPTVEAFVVKELTEQQMYLDMTNSEARRRVMSYIQRSLFALGCSQDDVAVQYEQLALRFAKRWNDDMKNPDIRDTIFYDKLREAVVVDILTGQIPFPPEVLRNLRVRLEEEAGVEGADVFRRIMKNLEDEGRLPAVEQVEDQWKMSPY
jgi:hypothetical protein